MKAVDVESFISDCLSNGMVPKAGIDGNTIVPVCHGNSPVRLCNGSVVPKTEIDMVNTNSPVCNGNSPLRLCNGNTSLQCVQKRLSKDSSEGIDKFGDHKNNECHRQSSISFIGDCKTDFQSLARTANHQQKPNWPDNSGLMNGISSRSIPKKEQFELFMTRNEGNDENLSMESMAEVENNGRLSHSLPKDIPQLQADSGLESAASSWDQAEARLKDELQCAREQLKLRDDEVSRLTKVRAEVESELEDLTASLFQEAHAMVRLANERQAAAEKALRESSMQVEVLTAEVAALKTLVLTSTPSRPNPHLHPQIDPKSKDEGNFSGNPLFRKHRRSPSHFNLKYGRENSPPDSPTKEPPPSEPVDLKETGIEVDPVLYKEFLSWKENMTMEQSDSFIARVYKEDINSCLTFSNSQLASEVRSAVESDTIYIEAVNEKSKTHFPKKCALLEAPRICLYRMRFGDTDTWHSISQLCRNRIIAVCDFLNYLKYIQRGLVKSSVNDVYWEMVRLRKEMVLARLGLPLVS